jgi:hypothetical protein
MASLTRSASAPYAQQVSSEPVIQRTGTASARAKELSLQILEVMLLEDARIASKRPGDILTAKKIKHYAKSELAKLTMQIYDLRIAGLQYAAETAKAARAPEDTAQAQRVQQALEVYWTKIIQLEQVAEISRKALNGILLVDQIIKDILIPTSEMPTNGNTGIIRSTQMSIVFLPGSKYRYIKAPCFKDQTENGRQTQDVWMKQHLSKAYLASSSIS